MGPFFWLDWLSEVLTRMGPNVCSNSIQIPSYMHVDEKEKMSDFREATHSERIVGIGCELLPLTFNNVHLPQCFLIVAGKNVPTLLIGNL